MKVSMSSSGTPNDLNASIPFLPFFISISTPTMRSPMDMPIFQSAALHSFVIVSTSVVAMSCQPFVAGSFVPGFRGKTGKPRSASHRARCNISCPTFAPSNHSQPHSAFDVAGLYSQATGGKPLVQRSHIRAQPHGGVAATSVDLKRRTQVRPRHVTATGQGVVKLLLPVGELEIHHHDIGSIACM